MRWTRVSLTLALLTGYAVLDATPVAGQRGLDFLSARPAVGGTAPNFSLLTLDGSIFRLRHEYRKRPVVLMFGSYT